MLLEAWCSLLLLVCLQLGALDATSRADHLWEQPVSAALDNCQTHCALAHYLLEAVEKIQFNLLMCTCTLFIRGSGSKNTTQLGPHLHNINAVHR